MNVVKHVLQVMSLCAWTDKIQQDIKELYGAKTALTSLDIMSEIDPEQPSYKNQNVPKVIGIFGMECSLQN